MLLGCSIVLMLLAASLSFFFKLVPHHDVVREINGHKTDRFTLPTGEIVSNSTWVQDETRVNNLSFRESTSAPPQPLKIGLVPDIDTWSFEEIALNKTRLFRYPDRLVLVIDPYIFVSEKNDSGPSWQEGRFLFDQATTDFLQIFLPPDGPAPSYLWGHFYHFDHLENEGRTLFLTRTANGAPYPQFLVYRLSQYDKWEFDLDATNHANQFPSPKDPGLVVDVAVVKYSGEFSLASDIKMDQVLARPGSAKVYEQSYPLTASDWVACKGDYPGPDGEPLHLPMQIHFGFWDLSPGYLSVFLQGPSYYAESYRHIKQGQWQAQTAERHGHFIFETFYRVRER